MRDGFVLRHDPAKCEKQPAEGAFLACTLWLADAYVLAGEFGKAQELFDRVVASPTISACWPRSTTRLPAARPAISRRR